MPSHDALLFPGEFSPVRKKQSEIQILEIIFAQHPTERKSSETQWINRQKMSGVTHIFSNVIRKQKPY